MPNKDNGGAAFPCPLGWIETDMNSGAQTCVDVRDVSHGMSMRDYFAGQAIAGMFSPGTWPKAEHMKTAAAAAYIVADAMLAARGAS